MPSIPQTAAQDIDYRQVNEQVDAITHEPLHTLQYPIVRTGGTDDVMGAFMDLRSLQSCLYVQNNDPITNERMNWRYWVPMRLTHMPHDRNMHYNYTDNEREFEYAKSEWAPVYVPYRASYEAFRQTMARETQEFPRPEWLLDYWKNHPYNPEKDPLEPMEQYQNLAPDPDTEKAFHELVIFRYAMLIMKKLYPHQINVQNYWIVHPLDNSSRVDDAATTQFQTDETMPDRPTVGSIMAPVIFHFGSNYKAFRGALARETGAYHHVEWLQDYWKNHPYNPQIDEVRPMRQYINLAPDPDRETAFHELVNFRHAMHIRRDRDPGQSYIISYWVAHPLVHGTDVDDDVTWRLIMTEAQYAMS